MLFKDKITFNNLINEQLDAVSRELLRLCLMPSFFTRQLLIFSLPELGLGEYSDELIEKFLSLPFIARREMKLASTSMTYFSIHDRIKSMYSLSGADCKKYGDVLIKYFALPCKEAYLEQLHFMEKLRCELNMGNISNWKKCYQAALETRRHYECNKLLELLRSTPIAQNSQMRAWLSYYELIEQYPKVNPERQIEALQILSREYNSEENIDLSCYLQIFLGVLYDTTGNWADAKIQYENAYRLSIAAEQMKLSLIHI